MYRVPDELTPIAKSSSLWAPKRQIIGKLKSILTLRRKLLDIKTALTNPLEEQLEFSSKVIKQQNTTLCQESLRAINVDLAKIDKYLLSTINDDEQIKRLFEIITSVHCVGPITAVMIITTTNEFKDIYDPKKFACYAGVAPFVKNSGTIVKKAKVSNIANKKMKALLNVCAVNAARFEPDLNKYYLRKTENEGKPKMLVLNAIRYKLILRIFTCVSQNRPYVKNHTSLHVKNLTEVASKELTELSGKEN